MCPWDAHWRFRPTNQRVIVSRIYVKMQTQFLTLRQHSRRTSITNA